MGEVNRRYEAKKDEIIRPYFLLRNHGVKGAENNQSELYKLPKNGRLDAFEWTIQQYLHDRLKK